MGALIGFGAGIGIILIWWTFAEPDWRPKDKKSTTPSIADLMARAGLVGVSPGLLLGLCSVSFVVVLIIMAAVSGVFLVAVVLASMAGIVPIAVLRGRSLRRARELATVWPDAVDNLASAVRAGLSLPEALQQLGERGPDILRNDFAAFAADYQSTGRFHASLDRLKTRLADPVGDRVIEALRIARDVGGGDLGRMLRSLSGFLREDARTRGELESRQSWTVNGARMAVAAPWIVLFLMSFRQGVVDHFATGMGLAILVTGAIACVGAYRLMMWIGRLPVEKRMLA